MSSEGYVPTQIPSAQTTQYGAGGVVDTGLAAPTTASKVQYLCADCNSKVGIATTESAVRCSNCGCRILYKLRTNRMVQFEAR